MSRLVTNAIRSTAASSDAMTIDSAGKPSFPNGGVGKILQVVSTAKTDTTSTTSLITFVDISGMSVSITPSSSSSKILVIVDMRLGVNENRNVAYRIMRGSTAIYIGDAAGSRTRGTGSIRLMSDAKYDMQSETAVFFRFTFYDISNNIQSSMVSYVWGIK